MILQQRKRHRIIWMAIGMLVPVAYLLAILVIPDDKIEIPDNLDRMEISVNHISTGNGMTLEINIPRPLSAPGSLVLLSEQSDSKPETTTVLGQVYGSGSYKFPLPPTTTKAPWVLIYNPFSKMVTHRIPL